MSDTFLVVQASPKETIEYEVPNALREVFDELVAKWPRALQGKVTMPKVIRLLETVAPDLTVRIVETRKPVRTPPLPITKGYIAFLV